MSETTITAAEVDANVAAFLEQQREQAAQNTTPETSRPTARAGRRVQRRKPLSDATKLRLSERLIAYNASQDKPASEVLDARRVRGWSQTETAKLAGIPLSSYRDVEKGRSLDVVNIARVRHVLGLPL